MKKLIDYTFSVRLFLMVGVDSLMKKEEFKRCWWKEARIKSDQLIRNSSLLD